MREGSEGTKAILLIGECLPGSKVASNGFPVYQVCVCVCVCVCVLNTIKVKSCLTWIFHLCTVPARHPE